MLALFEPVCRAVFICLLVVDVMSGTIETIVLHLFLAENRFVLDWLMICYCAKPV